MEKYLTSKNYKEVCEVLNENEEIRKCIPNNVLKHIKLESLKCKENLEYTDQLPKLEQLDRKSLALYVYLFLKYVGYDEKIKNIIIKNEIEYKKLK